MGYKIEYQPELNNQYRIPGTARFKRSWLLWGAGCFGGLLLGLIPSVRNWLWDLLIPGDPDVTTKAFGGLVNDLQEGIGFSEAVTTFCQVILANG